MTLKVGDVLTTPEQLDACPTGTIVRHNNFWVFARDYSGVWEVTGAHSSRTSAEVFDVVDDVTVIWLPPVTRVEMTTATWGIDSSRVFFLHTPELLGLLRSVLVGGRVRVTVEKIGNDDE